MANLTPESVPYGVSRFEDLRNAGRYFVDKSDYISKLEQRADFLFFVRPRRFGKSLFIDMLRCYYDINKKEQFSKLFGDLAIGNNPTKGANSYQVLALDFSEVNKGEGRTLEERFEKYLATCLEEFINQYGEKYGADFVAGVAGKSAADVFSAISKRAKSLNFALYLMIDEYDNFTNQLLRAEGNARYESVTHGEGFYREWFKSFKSTFSRIFMTGVSPVTMDDLTSGFNIATNISREPGYNSMIGFTREQTRQIFADFKGVGKFINDIDKHLGTVENWYDGYCFSEENAGREHVFNCDMVLYYLNYLVANGTPPKSLIDGNIKSDWGKLSMLLALQKKAETFDGILPLTEELADHEEVTFELADSFQVRDVIKPKNFKSLYYYYGIVTLSRIDFEGTYFRVPNECVRRQIFEYMRDCYERDGQEINTREFVHDFTAFARKGDWQPIFRYLGEQFKVNSVVRDSLNGEPLVNGFMRAYLTMRDGYNTFPELELNGRFCDYAFFPNTMLPPELRATHSYVIELKYSKASAPEAEISAKHAEALAQLEAYSRHPNLAALAAGTPVHFLDVEFVGRDLVRCEEISF